MLRVPFFLDRFIQCGARRKGYKGTWSPGHLQCFFGGAFSLWEPSGHSLSLSLSLNEGNPLIRSRLEQHAAAAFGISCTRRHGWRGGEAYVSMVPKVRRHLHPSRKTGGKTGARRKLGPWEFGMYKYTGPILALLYKNL